MSAIPSEPTSTNAAFSFVKRNKFRVFMAISLALHGIVGLGWGVPAYIHDQKLKARAAEEARQAAEAQQAVLAKVEQANDRALNLAKADITRALRGVYDTLVRDLSEPRQEQLWIETIDHLAKPIENLAKAMGDSGVTEQDLRNLQADLNRQLVETVNRQLAVNLKKWTQDDILAQVREKLVPVLQNHYRSQLGTRVGKPMRDQTNELIKTARADKSKPADAVQKMIDGIAQARTGILTPSADKTFSDAFGEFTADRIAQAVIRQFEATLEARKLQDETYLAETRQRIADFLRTEVMKDGQFGVATTNSLKDLGTPVESPEVVENAKTYAGAVEPRMIEGVITVAKDAAADESLLKRASMRLSTKEDDTAYRVETMAQHAAEGRTIGGLDMSDQTFAQLREQALMRADEIAMLTAADGNVTEVSFMDDGTQPATQPAIDPLVEAAMADVWKALRVEFDKLIAGRRTPVQAEVLWGHVHEAMTPAVRAFAVALLDPSLSKTQLEVKRTELNTLFAELVRKMLEAKIAQELGEQLVEQIKGEAGDKIVEAYKEPLKATIGREMTQEIARGQQQQKRDAIEEFSKLKGAVDKVAQTSSQVAQGVNNEVNRVNKLPKEPAKQAESLKAGAEKTAALEQQVKGVAEQVKAVTADTRFRAPQTRQKLDELKSALDGAAAELEKAKEAASRGDAETARDATIRSKDAVARLNAAAREAQAAVNAEIDEAARQFAAAAKKAIEQSLGAATQPSDQPAPEKPTVAQKIDEKFEEKFTQQAMDPLVAEILRRFDERLKKEGVDDVVDEQNRKQIAEALKQTLAEKVQARPQAKGENAVGEASPPPPPAGASAGSVALSAVDLKVTKEAEKAQAAEPTKEIAEKVEKMADKVIDAGVTTATKQLRGQQAIGAAVSATAGPDAEAKELQKTANATEAAARAGHGSLMSDAAGESSLENLRNKWLAAAGLGDGEGGQAGDGLPGAAQANAAAGNGAGNQAGDAIGAGVGRGAGPRGGERIDDGIHRVGIGSRRSHRFDRKKLEEIAQQSKERGNVTGDALEREGAVGETSRAEAAPLVVAAVVAPKVPPQVQVKNGDPFEPKFKSLRFATVPFLSKPFTLDADLEKWKDIPEMELLPETFGAPAQDLSNLRIEPKQIAKMAWDSSGLWFIVKVIDPNNRVDIPSGANVFWSGDVIEVWVDMLNTKERMRARGTGQQFWCWPWGSASDPNLTGGESVITRQSHGYYPMTASGMQRATKKTGDGYIVEFHIPSARLRDGELAAGKIVGFNITIETGSRVHYYWSSSKAVATYGRPDTWGDILLGGADGTLEIPTKLTGEGTAAEASETRNAFVIGEPLRLRVTDRDMNLNSRYRDKVAVTVRNARGEQTFAILEETTVDSGIFEGAVRTGLAIGEPVPATLSVYEGESVTVTYVDQARGNGARNAEIVYTVRAASPLTRPGATVAAK